MCYTKSMKNEADFRKAIEGLSRDQLVDMLCQMDRRYNDLQANYDELRRKYYGVKNNDSAVKGQLSLFNEIEETIDEATVEELTEPDVETIIPKKKKTPKNAKLKRVQIEEKHIRREEISCPRCGKPMEELHPTTIDYLEFQPAKYILKRYIIHNYTCHDCNEENLDCAVYTGDTSILPARLIDGSIATSPVISNMATNKFLLGLPFHRKSKDL